MASAGTVTVDFAAETAKFHAELKQVNSRLKGMESGFSSLANVANLSLGFLSVGAVVNFGKAMFNAADAIGDAAAKFGTSAESLSRLKFAAEQNDVEFQSLAVGIKTVQKNISEAAGGVDSATKKFTELGLSASALRELSLEDQFKTLADAFKDIKSPADQTRIAMELFGKAGADLVPLLNQGSSGIDQLIRKADELGITLSNTTAAGIGAADAALKQFKATVSGFATEFLGNILINSGLVELSEPIDVLTLKLKQLENQRFQILHTDLLNESRKGLEAINTEIDVTTKKLTELQRLQAGGSAVASGPNSRSPRLDVRTGNELEAVGLTSSSSAQSGADKVREINEQLAIDILEIQDRAYIESINRQFSALSELGAANREIFAETDATYLDSIRTQEDALISSLAYRTELERQAAEEQAAIKQGIVNSGIDALNAINQSDLISAKKRAKINKIFNLAMAAQNTYTAITNQLSSGDPYTAVARAVAVGAFGALQIAAIARTDYGSGSSSITSGSSVNQATVSSDTDTDSSDDGASQQRVTQIIFNGPVSEKQWIIDTIQEAVNDNDVVIISPNSRQASELQTA